MELCGYARTRISRNNFSMIIIDSIGNTHVNVDFFKNEPPVPFIMIMIISLQTRRDTSNKIQACPCHP